MRDSCLALLVVVWTSSSTPPESRTVPISIHSATAPTTGSHAGPALTDAASEDSRTSHSVIAGRAGWLRWYPIALGLGGLGGSWRTAVTLGAPAWPAASLSALSLGAWTTVTVMYVLRGGGRPRAFIEDLRHPEQGFALGYIPLIPLLLLAHAPRTPGFRILDLGLAAVWAINTAALVAHWITTPRDRHAIHPGFSLPVIGGPFIACISLQGDGWYALAQGLFTVGVYFGVTFGSLIVSRLMPNNGSAMPVFQPWPY
jgi:tellurite resistance protein